MIFLYATSRGFRLAAFLASAAAALSAAAATREQDGGGIAHRRRLRPWLVDGLAGFLLLWLVVRLLLGLVTFDRRVFHPRFLTLLR